VIEASIVKEDEELYGVILAFNVKILPDAQEEAFARGVKIFEDRIIYGLLDSYLKWMREQRERRLQREFEALVKPGKIRLMPGFVFRRSKPAIVGVEVLVGRIKPKYRLVREDGQIVGSIMQIQDKGENVQEATRGMQVAISIDKPIVGRHIKEGDVLHVWVPDRDRRLLLEKFSDRLSPEEVEELNALAKLRKSLSELLQE